MNQFGNGGEYMFYVYSCLLYSSFRLGSLGYSGLL